ncbi:hypothetical protein ACXGQW_07370 [Wenyingzhuangia sp. IMCC45533]
MSKKQIAFNWLLLLFLGLTLNFANLTNPLKGRHAWANADHYAISLGFINNGFDFFHPETFCLNPQFSPQQKTKSDFWQYPPENPKGTTTIDFPIHHYTISLLMKTLGTTKPIVYRLYTLAFCLIGLFFLGKTVFNYTQSYKWSIFVQLFVLLAPTYTFYSSSFLPSSIAVSLLFISSSYFSSYLLKHDIKKYLIGTLILTLAALTRFPFLIYFIGFVCFQILKIIFFRKKTYLEIMISLAGISIVLGYFFYNKFYLFQHYGSNFLSYPLYPTSLSNVYHIFVDTVYHESWRYFTLIHYLILFYFAYLVLKNKLQTLVDSHLYLAIVSLGVILYMTLMLRQFVAHDYYYLDTFLPITVFWMIGIYFYIPKRLLSLKTLTPLLMLAVVFNFTIYYLGYKARSWDPLEITRQNFVNADKTLDSLKIPSSSKLLLLDSYSPNLAFIHLNRKGFCVMATEPKIIKKSLTWDYEYIITQNFTYKDKILANYPNFEQETKVFYSNDKFTIHLKK